MRVAVAAIAALFGVLVVVVALVTARDPSAEELLRRCNACRPAWNGYQEDIKEIGARPVARWHGQPVSLNVVAGEVRLVMALEPPWDNWPAAIPVLVLDPEGRVCRNTADERDGARRVYIFSREEAVDEPAPPWLEIAYPHTKRRIYLDPQGTWKAPADGANAIPDRP